MGADYPGQEKAVKQIKSLPKEVRELLSHHLRNSLVGIVSGIESLEVFIPEHEAWDKKVALRMAQSSVAHILEDLKKFGL